MESQGIIAPGFAVVITRRNTWLRFHIGLPDRSNQDGYNPSYQYDPEPPPPQITSQAIIAVDLTEKFLTAAKSMHPCGLQTNRLFTMRCLLLP